MSATVEIQTKNVTDVMTVPIQSVTTREDTAMMKKLAGKKEVNEDQPDMNDDEKAVQAKKTAKSTNVEYVFIYKNGTVVMQKVKTGVQDNSYIEIKEGLQDKDEVISGPYTAITKKLKNGDKVKKVDKSELFNIKMDK